MESLFDIIANLGFPIVITMYLLIRLEGKMESLTSSINSLTNALIKDKSDGDEQ